MKAYITILGHEDEIQEKEVKEIDGITVVFNDGSSCRCHRKESAFHYWKTEEDAKGACLLMAQVKKTTLEFFANTMRDIIVSTENIDADTVQVIKKTF